MKIAYLLDEDLSRDSGVSKKIASQVSIWKSLGHQAVIYSIRNRSFFVSGNQVNVKKGDGLAPSKFGKLQRHFRNVKEIGHALKSFKPDLIYMRYIKYAPSLVSTLKGVAPYIVEVNTDDSAEFGLKSFFVGLYNKWTRGALLKNAAGFVSVTSELKNNRSFAKFGIPAVVIANGYPCKDSHAKCSSPSIRRVPQVVFVGSPDMSWHGLDKIYYMARQLPQFVFHIVGPSRDEVERDACGLGNVKAHGYLANDAIEKICSQCDVGISTLALHRKNMKEACPLKSRQYLALGLPIIIGYEDPDLAGELDFVLNIGNTEANVVNSIDKIKQFVCKSWELDSSKIQEFARRHLDWLTKERRRCAFFDAVVKAQSDSTSRGEEM